MRETGHKIQFLILRAKSFDFTYFIIQILYFVFKFPGMFLYQTKPGKSSKKPGYSLTNVAPHLPAVLNFCRKSITLYQTRERGSSRSPKGFSSITLKK